MEKIYSLDDVLKIAKYQKNVIWIFLAGLFYSVLSSVINHYGANWDASIQAMLVVIFSLLRVVFFILLAGCVFRLAKFLQEPRPWVYAIATIIPLAGIFAVIVPIVKASKVLKSHGIKVRLYGADAASLDRFAANHQSATLAD